MEALRSIVKNVVADLVKKNKALDFQKAERAWKTVIGPDAWPHTKIVYLTKNKIRVNVDSSAWLYDLNLRKERICGRLRKSLNIEDVQFRLGRVD